PADTVKPAVAPTKKPAQPSVPKPQPKAVPAKKTVPKPKAKPNIPVTTPKLPDYPLGSEGDEDD
ncbi:MAG: hypothetical protein K2J28_05735, partial [Duncaniella sp.]|nr:hypothetical protein [Duncaniella sp.]